MYRYYSLVAAESCIKGEWLTIYLLPPPGLEPHGGRSKSEASVRQMSACPPPVRQMSATYKISKYPTLSAPVRTCPPNVRKIKDTKCLTLSAPVFTCSPHHIINLMALSSFESSIRISKKCILNVFVYCINTKSMLACHHILSPADKET